MPDTTTLVCLFHHEGVAQAALAELQEAGIPAAAVTTLGGNRPKEQSFAASLESFGVPSRDQQHIVDGLADGGIVIAVSTISEHEDVVESIFQKHRAKKIDERDREISIGRSAAEEAAAALLMEKLSAAKKLTPAQAPAAVAPTHSEIPRDSKALGDVRTLRMFRSSLLSEPDASAD